MIDELKFWLPAIAVGFLAAGFIIGSARLEEYLDRRKRHGPAE